MSVPKKYTLEQLLWIKENRKRLRSDAHREFCKKFNRDDVNLENYHALCKRRGWFTGRSGLFKKEHVPFNKGQKMPYNANSAKTQFKKGNKPHNTGYVGHERPKKGGYIEISIAETNPHNGCKTRYVLKHRYLWEQKNGKLPEGMCLKCLDSNRQNCDPSNWEAIPKGTLSLLSGRNSLQYDKMPVEIKPTVMALAKLKYKIKGIKE